jgi:hypothetical protein
LASKSHVVLKVSLRRLGSVRIKVPAGLYHKADARDIHGNLRTAKANGNCRTAICIQARESFKKSGIDPGFVSWKEMVVEVVAHLNEDEAFDENEGILTPHDAYRRKVARNLRRALDSYEEKQKAEQLSLFEDHPAQLSADDICGCVPFPVTKK